jgi:hypothetical protein
VSPAAEDLAARLASGEDLGTIAMAMLDPATRETVKHCAAVATFDAARYERILRSVGGPSLDELREARRVHPVPGRPDCYRLEEYLREGAWSAWWTDEQLTPGSTTVPPSLARFAGQLADDYRAAGEPLEELRALLLADTDRARDLFLRLYAEADAAFDLARAQDVIDVLATGDRAQVLPEDGLPRLRNEHQVFLSGRSMWAAEYHQTARYLLRQEPERKLTGLLEQEEGQILQIVAPGGTGKTMQLRWLVARNCQLQRPPVPCAWIDFDMADPRRAATFPWLILLELARQLDLQIPGAPFSELVRDYERYLPLLSQAPEPGLVSVDEGTVIDAEDIAYRFCAALAPDARPADAPVVLLLDTMEEVVLRSADDASGIAEMLDRVCREAPSARLILSGRYDLADRLDGIRQRFGQLRTLRIAEFSAAEASRYLTAIRGITRPDLVDAIVRKCDGLPFTLALFGDVAAQDPDLSVAEIEHSSGPALLYCIVRILERIDDDRLRWVLRYGVVPRHLTLDFLEHVIWPHLIHGIEGGAGDDPGADSRPRRAKQIFRQAQYAPPADPGELRQLWDQLQRYASESSWVSAAGDRALVFHVRLRAPLRELISEQPVFEDLHRDAVAYYERRAGDEPGRWAMWTREALYHRFQSRDPGAGQAWRNAISHSWAAGRPEWAAELAADLLSADYLGEASGEPDRAVVTGQLRYEAHLQVARVNAEAARAARETGDGRHWRTSGQHIQQAARLADGGLAGGSSARLAILQASLELARGDQAAARAHLATLRGGTLSDEEHRDLLVLEAEGAALTGDAAIDERFGEAFEASVELGDTSGAAQLAASSAARHLGLDQPLAALRWCQRAEELDLAPPAQRQIASVSSAAWLELGSPGAAVRAVLPAGAVEFVSGRGAEAAAEALLALERPGDALRALLPDGSAEPPAEPGSWRRVLLCGRAYGMLLRIATATQLLERCLSLRPGDREGAALAGELALVHLRRGGDLNQAGYYLRVAEGYVIPPESAEWLELKLTRMELLRAQDRPGEARETLEKIFEQFAKGGATPPRVVRAAVRGLAVAEASGRDALMRVLLGALNEADLRSATRVGMLHDLQFCPTIEGVGTSARVMLNQTVLRSWQEARGSSGLEPDDQAWLDLAAVEVLRLLGRPAAARARLDQAVAVLARSDPLIWREWVGAADRIGGIEPDEPEPPSSLLERYRDYPAVSAAYLIDLTARRWPADPADRSLRRLDQADRLLSASGEKIPAWQARLAELRGSVARGTPAAGEARPVTAAPRPGLRLPATRLGERPAELTTSDIPWRTPVPETPLINELRTDWGGWVGQTGQILARAIGPGLAQAGPPGQTDIRLVCDGPPTAALPWEIAAVDGLPLARHTAVRFVYRGGYGDAEAEEARLLEISLRRLGVLDPAARVSGEAVRGAMRAFQDTAGLPPTDWPDRATWQELRRVLRGTRSPQRHVLMLQQDIERSIKSQRGYHASSADPVAIYRNFGVRVSVVTNPQASIAADWPKYTQGPSDPPDILHICAGLEVSARTPVLNFGEYGSSGALSAVSVSELVQATARDLQPPVVLDVLTPATGTEQIRQLLLRNIFCDHLVRLGQVSTVLGTGLASEQERGVQLGDLIQSLVGQENAADAWRRLIRPWGPPPISAETAVPEIGTALFSTLPPDAVMDPGIW